MLKVQKLDGVPKHVAIICDGNRRWARSRGLDDSEGHKAGAENGLKLAEKAEELGLEGITIWVFSTENWKRDKSEVKYLMKMFVHFLLQYRKELIRRDIRFRHLGSKKLLPKKLVKVIEELETETQNNKFNFNVALNYGGRDEIVRAVKNIVKDGVKEEDINEELISSYLDTRGLHEPDMVIRTSGEQRLSGFLPWQSTYSELFFVKESFPDLTPTLFEALVEDFTARNRRFGGN